MGYSIHAIMEDSVKFLAKLGHKKIGFVGELNTVSSFIAFRESMERNGLPHSDEFMHIINDRFEGIDVKAATNDR